MNFSQKLCFLMDSQKISAYKMSKDTGISDRLIGYWRKGEKLPNAENLIIIANYFNTPIDELLGRTDNKNGYSNNSNSFNNGDNSTQAIGDCNNISTNISSSDKNNMYNDIIEHLDTLSKSDRFRAIADITDILEEKYPVKKN